MSKITFSIAYAGLQLPIVQNEKGQDVTPLKPIADLFGLQWETQRKKVTGSGFLPRRLGTCTVSGHGAGGQIREQTCILLSRVAGYLMSINPDQVRVRGNADGADFLEQKIEEWDDALHEYEEVGVAVNLNHIKTQRLLHGQRAQFFQSFGILNKTSDLGARKAIASVMGQMADELGVPLQLDLVDAAKAPPV